MSQESIQESFLDHISIATPCDANWDEMAGGERVRHCQLCQLNVYNLSAMSKIEAEKLIEEKEGRLCVRYYRRADGTVLTQDCPVGLTVLHQKRFFRRVKTTGIVAAVAFVTVAGVFAMTSAEPLEKCPIFDGKTGEGTVKTQEPKPKRELMGEVEVLMGDVMVPPPQPQPKEVKGRMGKIMVPPSQPPVKD